MYSTYHEVGLCHIFSFWFVLRDGKKKIEVKDEEIKAT